MTNWQKAVILIYSLYSLIGFLKGLHESKNKKNAWGTSWAFFLMGSFAWGDAVIFGLFWLLVSLGVFLLNDWLLFLLILSIYWLVRSLGETIFWINQQFSKVIRFKPEAYFPYKIFHNDSVWFIYQIFCQCITVISAVTTIYLTKLWLEK